ncbi:MAG: FtsW/RodA/SpoVE family cell cycle protein, partial [Termitinemataceae bacterium]
LTILAKEHRIRRVLAFLQPDWDPLGAGYQVRSSVLTIMSGGLWGKGIGQGVRKIASIPEVHSDFIFAAFAEEWGLVGVTIVCILIGVVLYKSFTAAYRADTMYVRLVVVGIVMMLVTQFLLNLAVVSALIPATGIPLPFFSAGGSSLAMMLFAAGLLVNCSRSIQYGEDSHV